MSNIDLSEIFKKQPSISSTVDSDIKLNDSSKKDVLYSDVKFDLTPNEYLNQGLNAKCSHKDIAKITDEESILNSLRNILTTRAQSRLLNPEMDFDLRSYLFEPLTEAKAYFIGYDISMYLPIYEPRVMIDFINVTAYYNDDAYVIDLSVYIPSLSKSVKLSSILDPDGFTFT